MTHLRKLTAGVICGGVLFFCALVAPAFATSKPGYCAATSGDAVDSCQFEVLSYTQAPLPNVSMGIRLDAAVRYVLFNGIPSIGPRFVSNASNNDIFIPQATVGEFSSFLGNLPSLVTADYAVVPTTYTAVPSPVNVACGTATPSVVSILVPIIANTTSPVVVNSYSLVLDSANPSTTQTIVGSTVQGASPVEFTYTRQDCSTDNEGNKNCVTVTFVEDQKLVFSATGSKPDFSWGPPAVTSGIYTNNSLADCSISYPPSIDGVCGAANGASYTTIPTTDLCSSGNATAVTAGSGGVWTWLCAGVSGGSDQSCATTQAAACVPTLETRDAGCPGSLGGVNIQQRDYTCKNGIGKWGPWYDLNVTCPCPGNDLTAPLTIFNVWGKPLNSIRTTDPRGIACDTYTLPLAPLCGRGPLPVGTIGQTITIPSIPFDPHTNISGFGSVYYWSCSGPNPDYLQHLTYRPSGTGSIQYYCHHVPGTLYTLWSLVPNSDVCN